MGFLKRMFGGDRGKAEKHAAKPAAKPAAMSKPEFPLGENIVSDPDVRRFADLERYYPLPAGFVYMQTAAGVPMVVCQQDGMQFSFLIEADLLTFDLAYTKPDGKTAYKTTEVFKRA